MKEKTDKSFGIIPARKTSAGWEVLLIEQYSKIGKNTYWIFPKGHAEGSELPLESAKRELLEETGLQVQKIVPEVLFSLGYTFVFAGEKIIKTVDFFLGIITEFEMVLDPYEVQQAKWYSLDEALQRLDYADTKNMFQEVQQFLQTYPG